MKISSYHIQWAGQFYVASQLSRRGYFIAFTLGNAKVTDIIVSTQEGISFPVEIKTTKKRAWWHIVNEPQEDTNRYWILVSLGELDTWPRCFIGRNDQVRRIWKLPRAKGNLPGIKFNQIQDWEEQWDVLP